MSISDVKNILGFIGGLGMFLYGMKLMAGGLEKIAGDKMKNMLGAVTDKRIMGILMGAMVTAIIQSSGATTTMVVGFVNAGILNLLQSVGVIMGANIGTTATAWIVSLDSLGDTAELIKPAFYAPLMIGIGAAFLMFCKKHKKQNIGEIILSIGLLFLGLTTMSASMSPYMKNEMVQNAFLTLGKNPLLGLLIGIVVTGVMQSSSASVGVLQTMAGFGIVPAGTAVFICLGADIGSCFTAIISSAGASRNAKRAAMINLLFNTIGVVFWGTLIFIFFKIFPSANAFIMSSVTIAIFHSGFKLANTALFFPFAKHLVRLSEKIIKDKDVVSSSKEKNTEDTNMLLDDRILNAPSIAMQAVTNYVVKLGQMCSQNVKDAMEALMYEKYDLIQVVLSTEKQIDDNVHNISNFLLKLSNDGLTDKQSTTVKDLMCSVIDLERIGDHAENLGQLAEKMRDNGLKFSQVGVKDLERMRKAVEGSVDNAILAREHYSVDYSIKTFKYEEEVNRCEEELRASHIDRLANRECDSETSVIFFDILTNLERVSDHAVNIAGYVKEEA